MVSIRKRRHLGIFEKYKVLTMSRLSEQRRVQEPAVHMMETSGFQRGIPEQPAYAAEIKLAHEGQFGPSTVSGNSSTKDLNLIAQERELKRRKRQRRRQFDNPEACMLRGVYFKNMKWQAAIKVDKKQIHLGTVATMEEAARLYDRAAYMCGREPNFELSEEEKQQLQGIRWEDFLYLTRSAIASKKRQKKIDAGLRRKQMMGVEESSPSPSSENFA